MPQLPDPQQAAQAFIYGYPLVYSQEVMRAFVSGHSPLPVGGDFNEFAYARDLLGPETKFVSPNNDTLYVLACCDVRQGPLLLQVPDTEGRYYVLQLIDAWTNNFAYVGSRATGTEEGQFLLAAAGYDGPIPDGARVIEVPTGVCTIVGRVQLDGEADLPAVHALQDQFVLTPFGADALAYDGTPGPDPAVGDDLVWWEKFRVALTAFTPPAADGSFLEVCDALGLRDATSPYVTPAPELASSLVAAQKSGLETIEQLVASGGQLKNGWRDAAHIFDYNLDFFGIGTIDAPEWKIADRTIAYATRAVAARAGLYGNHGYEAEYLWTTLDADGTDLDGNHSYVLRLDTPPPVDAFWSVTMYDATQYYLVANPINRYSIGDRTPGLVTADDGSITIYLQHDAPGGDRDANWLPTPAGPFRPMMRMYQPRAEVLSDSYALPPITKA